MFRLTREVRFAINGESDPQWQHAATNTYGSYPSITGFAAYLTLRVTLRGQLDARSQYLINIKEIDDAARTFLRTHVATMTSRGPSPFLSQVFEACEKRWRERFDSVSLLLSPFLSCEMMNLEVQRESTMRLSQKFEFSASHRLHNPALSDEENRKTFGKCNNQLGHGHNYEVQVTLQGKPDTSGLMIEIPGFERAVKEAVIDRFDHKNLNVEVPEFRDVIPTVENISKTIYQLLKPKFNSGSASLASVTVWETPKTWCEYSE